MDDPARAERLWLALALATWWVLAVGGEAEAERPAATLPPVPGTARRQGRHWRLGGIFRREWNLIRAALLNQQPGPQGPGCPEPWPPLPPLQQSGLPNPNSANEKNLHL